MSISSDRIVKKFQAVGNVYDTFEGALEAVSAYYHDSQGYSDVDAAVQSVSEVFVITKIPYIGG